jgi:hypothetical protein
MVVAAGSVIADEYRYLTDENAKMDLPAADLLFNVSHFVEIQVRIKRSELSDHKEIIQAAQVCEAQLEQRQLQLPDTWKPETVTATGQEPMLFNGRYPLSWSA